MGMDCSRLQVRWYGRKLHSINLTLCPVETSRHQSMAFALAVEKMCHCVNSIIPFTTISFH